MRVANAERLRCPACGQQLRIEGDLHGTEIDHGSLVCTCCGRSFSIGDGIASLVHPDDLRPSDADAQKKYDAEQ